MRSILESTAQMSVPAEAEGMAKQSLVVRSSAMLHEQTEYNTSLAVHCDVVNANLTIVGNASFKGSILNSTIMCFGQLRVVGHCQGSTIYARGNVSAFIVRGSDIFSEQNILLQREATDSTLQAAASIFASTANVGASRLSACDTMILHKVRTETDQACELELGNIFLRRRKECILYRRMLADFHDLKTKREVVQALQHQREQGLELTSPSAHLLRADSELEQLITQSRQSEELYRSLCEQWANPTHYHTTVLSNIDAGTIIRIGEEELVVEKDRITAEYELSDGKLSFRYNSLKA